MQLSRQVAAEMIAKDQDEHLCDGVRIMEVAQEKNVPAILEKAGVTISSFFSYISASNRPNGLPEFDTKP